MYQRNDLSNKLIHFVHSANREDENYWLSHIHSYEFGFGEIVEDDIISPFFILRRILRKLQILSTWSFRNGYPTIRGSYPVTCFTEMPISAFVATSIERLSKGQKISNYALVFEKKQMFSIGARPVIYGTTKGEDLPTYEQYRFVSYDPVGKSYPIDWTHEREWRWPNFAYKNIPVPHFDDDDLNLSEEAKELMQLRDQDRIEFHGINLNNHELNDVGFILKTEKQAKLILRDILWLIDQKKIKKDLFTYILYFSDLEKNIGSINDPQFLNNLIDKGRIEVLKYLTIDHKQQLDVITKIDQLDAELSGTINSKEFIGGVTGKSYPCFNDNLNHAARLLSGTKYLIMTHLGRYLINLSCLNQTQSMEVNEKFVKEVLNPKLEAILKTPLTYYSVGSIHMNPIDKIDIDDVPFFTEPNDDEWNYAHKEEDF